nr:universal stress protein [Propionicimonas sp.]
MSESEPGAGGTRGRILVGVDGSEDGLRAVRYAMREAKASGADVWIVNVVDDMMTVGGLWELVSTVEALRKVGEEYLDEARQILEVAHIPAERITSEVMVGPPGPVLADLSEKASLMVLGRRSMSGLERMFVGSTSLAAAVSAKCPVIVISAASTPHVTGGLRKVAVAVSAWPVHDSVMEWAAKEATLRKAELRVVHVVPDTLGMEAPRFAAEATAELERHLGAFRASHPEISVSIDVQVDDPVNALVEVSKEVDLLILGLHHHRAALGGSVRGVVANAHCPVGLTD